MTCIPRGVTAICGVGASASRHRGHRSAPGSSQPAHDAARRNAAISAPTPSSWGFVHMRGVCGRGSARFRHRAPFCARSCDDRRRCRECHSPTRVASTETPDATSRHADPAWANSSPFAPRIRTPEAVRAPAIEIALLGAASAEPGPPHHLSEKTRAVRIDEDSHTVCTQPGQPRRRLEQLGQLLDLAELDRDARRVANHGCDHDPHLLADRHHGSHPGAVRCDPQMRDRRGARPRRRDLMRHGIAPRRLQGRGRSRGDGPGVPVGVERGLMSPGRESSSSRLPSPIR